MTIIIITTAAGITQSSIVSSYYIRKRDEVAVTVAGEEMM